MADLDSKPPKLNLPSATQPPLRRSLYPSAEASPSGAPAEVWGLKLSGLRWKSLKRGFASSKPAWVFGGIPIIQFVAGNWGRIVFEGAAQDLDPTVGPTRDHRNVECTYQVKKAMSRTNCM